MSLLSSADSAALGQHTPAAISRKMERPLEDLALLSLFEILGLFCPVHFTWRICLFGEISLRINFESSLAFLLFFLSLSLCVFPF